METRACAECGASLPSGVTDVFCPACALRAALGGGSEPREEFGAPPSPEAPIVEKKQFDWQWAATIMEQARTKLRQECIASGKSTLYDRVSLVDGQNENAVPHAVIAQELGMTISAVKSAVSRLRIRYGELVRQEVAHTVSTPSEVEEEIRHLLSVVGG